MTIKTHLDNKKNDIAKDDDCRRRRLMDNGGNDSSCTTTEEESRLVAMESFGNSGDVITDQENEKRKGGGES